MKFVHPLIQVQQQEIYNYSQQNIIFNNMFRYILQPLWIKTAIEIILRNQGSKTAGIDHINKTDFMVNGILSKSMIRDFAHINSFEDLIFRYNANLDVLKFLDYPLKLGDICYISTGMILNSDEKKYKGNPILFRGVFSI